MPWQEFAQTYSLVLAALLFGAFVARATGVGFALLLVASLLALPHLDQPTVLFLVAPLSILNLGLVALSTYAATPVGEVRRLSLPIFLGLLLGLTFGILVAKIWILIFGLCVVAYNIWTMARPAATRDASAMANPWIGGGLTGVMTGGLSFPGPPISAYMLARGHTGDSVRVTIALVAIVAALIRLLIGWPFMTWRPEFWQVLGAGCVLIGLGSFLGALAARHMQAHTHRRLILLLTFMAFVQLAWGLAAEF